MRLTEPGRWDEFSWVEHGAVTPRFWVPHTQAIHFRGIPLYFFCSRYTASFMNALVSQKVRRAFRTGLPFGYPVHLQKFPAHITLKQSMRSGESYSDDSIQETHSDSIIKQ